MDKRNERKAAEPGATANLDNAETLREDFRFRMVSGEVAELHRWAESMPRILQLVDQLRSRSDLTVSEESHSFVVSISKGSEFVCEVTIPKNVLEWFASVVSKADGREVWKDWMDYEGYDDRPGDELEDEMAGDIAKFIDRLIKEPVRLPLAIWLSTEEEKT